ncbi:hypothetical protein RhiirC2_784883 [Rhizophagus irregularis]|uniref:Uncharacterized protein n=1 Tax=Rhizophagus irregularis TaxID=588596 RepID=A0A2N1MXJ0_9GLOM|nr:hypothetical protein RhiirC2_784883 [Rhizophagus irregularis]
MRTAHSKKFFSSSDPYIYISGSCDTAFENFPITLYKARNILNIEDQFHCFAACTKYHKLYNKKEVEEFHQDIILAIMKCQHIEFPNSSRCQKCQTPLSHQIRLLNKVSN